MDNTEKKTEYKNFTIKSFAKEDRPREKMLDKGVKNMTNMELLAIILRTGTKTGNALSLSCHILNENNNSLKEILSNDVYGLKKVKGIGDAKAITIIAALELGIRCSAENDAPTAFLKTSNDIYALMRPIIGMNKYEEFWVIYLAQNLKVITKQMVGGGGVNSTIVDPRRVFKTALDVLASAIILCHNHPSGNTEPSVDDRQITKKMVEVGKLMDVRVIDHLVITDKSYYSFHEHGTLH